MQIGSFQTDTVKPIQPAATAIGACDSFGIGEVGSWDSLQGAPRKRQRVPGSAAIVPASSWFQREDKFGRETTCRRPPSDLAATEKVFGIVRKINESPADGDAGGRGKPKNRLAEEVVSVTGLIAGTPWERTFCSPFKLETASLPLSGETAQLSTM